jgi:hypothetical protein
MRNLDAIMGRIQPGHDDVALDEPRSQRLAGL